MVALAGRQPAVARDAIEELKGLTQAVEIEQVIRLERGIGCRRGEIIGAAQRDGGMPPIRESDDEIRIDSAAETDDRVRVGSPSTSALPYRFRTARLSRIATTPRSVSDLISRPNICRSRRAVRGSTTRAK